MGADPKLSIAGGRDCTPLNLAVWRHVPIVTQKLLDHGADVNMLDSNGISALDEALKAGNVKVLRLLLQHADKSTLDALSHTALHFDAYSGNMENFKTALQQWQNVWVENKWGCTPLHEAATVNYVLCFLKGASILS